MQGFELAMFGEGVDDDGEGLEGVRGGAMLEDPVPEFQGRNVVVLEGQEEVCETEGCERERVELVPVGVDHVAVGYGYQVQILTSSLGDGSVRYGKQCRKPTLPNASHFAEPAWWRCRRGEREESNYWAFAAG